MSRLKVYIESKRGADVWAGLDDEVKELLSDALDLLIEAEPNTRLSKKVLALMEGIRDHQIATTELRNMNFTEVEKMLSERGYQIRFLEEQQEMLDDYDEDETEDGETDDDTD